jgi:tubby-related protein 1
VDSEGNQKKVWQPKDDSDEHMATCLKDKESPQNKNLISFVNKPPTWNETVKNYVFNFNGRKTLASVKNFQLIDESDPEKIFLQFGRIGKEEFALDLQWPLSPFQAFAFALSSFDSKLGCD